MGNCKSSVAIESIHSIKINSDYILFETCNDQTKERIYEIMDKRIREEISKDKYNTEFCLKTFFLPDQVFEEKHLYTYYDIYPNIEINTNESTDSIKKDVYVNYTFILDRLKRMIHYPYVIHHSYWYSLHDVFDNKQKYVKTLTEPFQYQNIDGIDYKWYGLLHISRIIQPSTTTEITEITINLESESEE
jgi:hypothetical protein